jgi:hydrogenase expression/formation protein HypC
MCLAVPGKILEIISQDSITMAKIGFPGTSKEVCLDLVPDAGVGDYVIVHAGFAISVLDEAEALKTIELMKAAEKESKNFMHWDSSRP